MPKKSSLLSPPSAEARADVLAIVRRQSEPIALKAVAKLLPAAHRMSDADLQATVQEFLSASQLCEYPPKTASGPLRYWDRDTRWLARDAVSHRLSNWPEPIAAKELATRLGLPFKVSENDLATILADFVTRGLLHEIPAATAKGKIRYWNQDRSEYFRSTVLQVLQVKGPLPEAKLQSSVKGITPGEWQLVRETLRQSRKIFLHPSVGKKGKAAFGLRPPTAAPYLKEFAGPITAIITTLTEAEVAADDIRRAIVEMVEAAGIPFGVSRAATSKPTDPVGSSTSTAPDRLIELMMTLEPGAARGTLIGVRDLRRSARMDKAVFDAAVLQLSRQGKVALHWHDFPASLTAEERDELVTDGAGNYYIGVALRTVESGDRS